MKFTCEQKATTNRGLETYGKSLRRPASFERGVTRREIGKMMVVPEERRRKTRNGPEVGDLNHPKDCLGERVGGKTWGGFDWGGVKLLKRSFRT